MANSGISTLLLLLLVRSGVTLLQDSVSMAGDITLGGLFSVQTNAAGSCGNLYIESIQIHQAVRWFLSTLNNQNYIPGVKLGLTAAKTCDDPSRAAEATINMLKNNGVKLYGVLGPEASSETQTVSRLLSSLPADDRLLQLSYSATAATLSDKSIYKNLYRVIEADDVQVEVLHQLLLEMKWNYVAIVYQTDAYGREGATALRKLAEQSDICVPVFYGIAADSSPEERRIAFLTLAEKLEKQSESPVIGLVFFGFGTTAKTMFSYLNLDLKHFQVIASEAISLNEAYLKNGIGAVFPRAKGLLTLSPPVYDPTAFKDYWTRLHSDKAFMLEEIKDNDWLLKYMESVTKCGLAGQVDVASSCIQRAKSAVSSGDISIYTSYVLMAVASVAKTLKGLQSSLCSGQSGMCPQMKDVRRSRVLEEMKYLQINSAIEFTDIFNFNFSYGFQNGEIKYNAVERVPTYSVYNYRSCDDSNFCFTKVGDYVQRRLNLSGSIRSYDKDGVESSIPTAAQCRPGFVCTACTMSSNNGEILFLKGDLYLVALVPIHDRGHSVMSCGKLRTSPGVDVAEGIVYAVNRINQRRTPFTSVLGDKTLGLILLDTCNSAFITRERIVKLHRGELQLSTEMNSARIVDRIIGYIGPYASSVCVGLSSVMTEVDKLFISYGSTSTTLSSRSMYPNYMRTASPDYKQADVIMYLAKELKSEYVQLIYSDEEYGRAAKVSLELAARKYKICLAQSIPAMDSSDKTDFIGFVADLRKYRHAKLVIIFVRSHITPALIDALTDEINSGEFLFIGAESWGRRQLVLKNDPKLLGSLTLTQELPTNQRFGDYFSSIDVQNSSNPWLQEFIELRAGCYYPNSFNKGKNGLCGPNAIAEHGEADTWVPFAINGVYSLVLGFNSALEEKCPGTYTMCPEYSTEDLKTHVKMARLDINGDGSKVRVLDDNGEGNVGYTLYQVVKDGADYRYNKVGRSSDDGIDFQLSRLIKASDFTSACQNEVDCGACKLQFKETASSPEPTNTAAVALGVFVAILLLVVLALIVVIVVSWRRHKTQVPNTRMSKDHGVYINPVPDPRDSMYDSKTSGQSVSADSNWYDLPTRTENSGGSHVTNPHISDGSAGYENGVPFDVPMHSQYISAPI